MRKLHRDEVYCLATVRVTSVRWLKTVEREEFEGEDRFIEEKEMRG